MSQPELQRQLRQQRGDIDALYELVQGVDRKVDALDLKLQGVDRKVDALDLKLQGVDRKVDALDLKLDRRFDEISGQFAEVLRRLDGR